MDFRSGERIQRPPGTDPSWYAKALAKLRREEMGDLPMRIELVGGGDVVGHLDQVSTVVGSLGMLRLDEGDRISCEEIEAITLLADPGD